MNKLIFFVMLLILSNSVSGTYLNEIYYNPEETPESDYEYIEVYSEENIDGFILRDDDGLDEIKLVQWRNSSYSVIVKERADWSTRGNLYYAEGLIGSRGLRNTGEFISLWNGSELVDAIRYFGNEKEGNSFCKLYYWEECYKTPGSENYNKLEREYPLRINELMPDPAGEDYANMPSGEWLEIYNFGEDDINLEGFGLKDNYGSEVDIIISDSNVLDGGIIEAGDYKVIYVNKIRDGFLTNEGFEKIYFYDPEGFLIDEVSYSGSNEDSSWNLVDDVWVINKPSAGSENYQERLGEGFLEIEKVYLGVDEDAKWGDTFLVKVVANKGNSSKNSLKLYVDEGISLQTKVDMKEKYKNYTFTLPINIDSNCNLKYKDGEYDLVLKGFDMEERKVIEIEELKKGICERIYLKDPSGEISYNLYNLPSTVKSNEQFEISFEIENNLSEDQTFNVWSYVYEGMDVLTSEYNTKEIEVPAKSSSVVVLENDIGYLDDGEYNFKVKVQKEGLKTAKEFKDEINVENKGKALNREIYKSNNEEIKRAGVYFLCALLILLIIGVLKDGWKNNN